MKTCNTCRRTLPNESFQRDKTVRCGLRAKCRECVMQRQRELRAAHPERERAWVAKNMASVRASKASYRARNSERLKIDARSRARKRREDPEFAAKHREVVRQYQAAKAEERKEYTRKARARNPLKFRARAKVRSALESGRLKKPTACTRCGSTRAPLHAHHEDYTRPLDVVFLCSTCHGREHRMAS